MSFINPLATSIFYVAETDSSTGSGAQAAPLASSSPAPAMQTLTHPPHQEARRQHLIEQLSLNTKPAPPAKLHWFTLSHDMEGNSDSESLCLDASLAPEIGRRLASLLNALPHDAFVHNHDDDVWTVADHSFSSGEGAGWTLALAGSGKDIHGYRLTDPNGASVSWPEPVSDSPSGDGPPQQGRFAGKKRPRSSSSSSSTNSVSSLAASAAPAEGASDGDARPRTIYDDIKVDAKILDKWEKLPEDRKTTSDLYQALLLDGLSTDQHSMLKAHFDPHLVRMEIERVENESERAKLRHLHDRQQAYKRNLPSRKRNRADGVLDISKEEKQYLAQRIPELRRAAINRLLNGSFTDAAKAARAYDERTTSIGGNANTINLVKQAVNAFLTRCFPSLPFLVSMVALAKDKPELFIEKTKVEVLAATLYVDRWLADPRNTINPDAFLNPKETRESLAAMLEIKRKISYTYATNTNVLQGLKIWREQTHHLRLDTVFNTGIEMAASNMDKTKTKWHAHRVSLAEYPLIKKISDREFIEKLKDLETQKAFTLWAHGPLGRRQNERDADFAKREKARVSTYAGLMRCLAKASAVQAYAKTPEAWEKAGA